MYVDNGDARCEYINEKVPLRVGPPFTSLGEVEDDDDDVVFKSEALDAESTAAAAAEIALVCS